MSIITFFKRIFRPLRKEPMYYETDSYADLSTFYNEEANKTAESSSAKLKKDVTNELKRLNARREHDEEVLDFRKLRKKKKEDKKSDLKPSKSFLDKQNRQDKQESTALVATPIHAPVAVVESEEDDLSEE